MFYFTAAGDEFIWVQILNESEENRYDFVFKTNRNDER